MRAAIHRLLFLSFFLISVFLLFQLSVVLADENLPPVADAGPDIETSEAQYVSFSASASTDPDGQDDIVSFYWDFGDGGTGGSYNDSHSYSEDGVYFVTLTITDSEGHIDSASLVVTVNNIAASIGGFSPSVPQALINEVITAQANFADQGVTDTHTAIWDWGDGQTSEGDVVEDNGSGSAFGAHFYEEAGEYIITLTVTDNGEASEHNTTTITIVAE